jgi:hypothetical protein
MAVEMKSVGVVVSILLLGAGCDPGWSYHVADSPVGMSRQSDDRGGVSMRTKAGLSTGSLDVEIDVTNGGTDPVVIHEGPFRVLDSSRRPLAWYWGQPSARPCEQRQEKLVTLDRGQSCTIRGRFVVHPNAGVFAGRNTDLKTLTVIVDGLVRGAVPIASSTVLEWDLN